MPYLSFRRREERNAIMHTVLEGTQLISRLCLSDYKFPCLDHSTSTISCRLPSYQAHPDELLPDHTLVSCNKLSPLIE